MQNIAVYSKKHREQINTLHDQDVEFHNIRPGGTKTTGFYKVSVISIVSSDLRKMRLALDLPAFIHCIRQGVSVIPMIPVC